MTSAMQKTAWNKLILQAVNDNIHASRNPRYAGNVKNLIFDHVGSLD